LDEPLEPGESIQDLDDAELVGDKPVDHNKKDEKKKDKKEEDDDSTKDEKKDDEEANSDNMTKISVSCYVKMLSFVICSSVFFAWI
jgi:uncharacterized protein YqhQ